MRDVSSESPHEAAADDSRSVVAHGSAPSRWRAELSLRYHRDGSRSVLGQRRHFGPLVVQKTLYPEGEGVCQNIIVHPPGGIASGDNLAIDVVVGNGAHAQLTTPGAAKWYRSRYRNAEESASQVAELTVADDAILEWLPQESIVFNGAHAESRISIDLANAAVFLGWDIICLGRTAAGERFDHGRLRQRLTIHREGEMLFAERLVLNGGGAELSSPVALNDAPVFGTFIVAAPSLFDSARGESNSSDAMLAKCRETEPSQGEGAVTRLPGLIVARYRGASCEAGRAYFVDLWTRLRPVLIRLEAVAPRIWKT